MKSKLHIIILALWALLSACTPEARPDGADNDNMTQSGITVRGIIYDDAGNRLEGVVVSDCFKCTVTDKDGVFELESDLSVAKFIFISIPSGYSVPVKKGLPVFFKRLSEEKQTNGHYRLEFILNRMTSDPDKYSVLVVADPQPRSRGKATDKVAYHSLDVCEDLYRDMREKGSDVLRSSPCYAIVLGDIVHGEMDLFDTYISNGTSKMGFPVFNVLGNHDIDWDEPTDFSCSRSFEEKLGPVNYSFNLGKIHYVVVDNIIMTEGEEGLTGAYSAGLRDDIWQWLQADLSYVDKGSTIMICSHNPMFREESGKDNYVSARNGQAYADLLSSFKTVHAWAGHTHHMFNYVYDSDSSLDNIEVHTVVRATGDLHSNEYLSAGTPRGYVVVEVDGENVSWKYRPLPYQTGLPVNTVPEYQLRAWYYDETGVAWLKDGGQCLDESYQVNAYSPDVYGDGYIYANVFMWDQKWGIPVYVSEDGTRSQMELVTDKKYMYDAGYKELFDYYYEVSAVYQDKVWKSDVDKRMFRVYSGKKSDKGKVEVMDRFGNVYSTNVSW